MSVNSVNSGHTTNYVMCASGCFCVIEGTNILTPFFVIFSPFKGAQKEEGRY